MNRTVTLFALVWCAHVEQGRNVDVRHSSGPDAEWSAVEVEITTGCVNRDFRRPLTRSVTDLLASATPQP